MSDDSEFDGIMAAIGESLASRPAIKATPSVVVGYVDGPICNHGACLVDAADDGWMLFPTTRRREPTTLPGGDL